MKSRRTAVKALGEIALRVNDLDAMQRFYQEAIGLELMKRFPNAAFFRIAEGYGGHTQVLALFDRAGERRQGPQIHRTTPQGVSQDRSTLDHVAFEIDLEVLEDEKKRLEQLGLSVETTTHEWTQWRSLYVSDPEEEKGTSLIVCFLRVMPVVYRGYAANSQSHRSRHDLSRPQSWERPYASFPQGRRFPCVRARTRRGVAALPG